MPRALSSRRLPRPHPPHRLPRHRAHGGSLGSHLGSPLPPARAADLVLALLGVALLGGLALMAAFALAAGPASP